MNNRQRNAAGASARSARNALPSRRPQVERLEGRCLLAADALLVGLVYIEQDIGSDHSGDTFELTFIGGAEGSRLTRVVLDGDQVNDYGNLPGLSNGDVIFDTVRDEDSLGVDEAFPFHIEAMLRADGSPHTDGQVRAIVQDGESLLVLEFENFAAGDRLRFSIDVDEVEEYDPRIESVGLHNEGLDPLTSGAEFQGVLFAAEFQAPGFHDALIESTFLNRYDDSFAENANEAGGFLVLPADNDGGLRDRTAGASGWRQQQPLPIAISGTVFHDQNLDLTRQADEDPIADARLALYRLESNGYQPVRDEAGRGVETVTDAMGRYAFGFERNLPPGTYQVRQTQPTGFPISVGAILGSVDNITTGVLVDSNQLSEIALPLGGREAVGYDFAEALPASIAGTVFHDRNDNGQQDPGEQGIADVQLVLSDASGERFFASTDAEGAYLFEGLYPGDYVLAEMQPVDWFDGLDRLGVVRSYRGVDRAVGQSQEPDELIDLALLSGDIGREYDFGEQLGSLDGSVHYDQDGDCIRDIAEHGIADVLITLTHEDGREWTVRTDADGYYSFADLPPGVYMLDQEQPQDYFDGGQTPGTAGGDASQPNTIRNILLQGRQRQGSHYDFCETLGELSGYVYHDQNNDGVRDSAEAGIADVAIELLDADGRVVRGESGEAVRTWTDATGYYRFLEIPPGSYGLREQQPEAWEDGRETLGDVDGAG